MTELSLKKDPLHWGQIRRWKFVAFWFAPSLVKVTLNGWGTNWKESKQRNGQQVQMREAKLLELEAGGSSPMASDCLITGFKLQTGQMLTVNLYEAKIIGQFNWRKNNLAASELQIFNFIITNWNEDVV